MTRDEALALYHPAPRIRQAHPEFSRCTMSNPPTVEAVMN